MNKKYIHNFSCIKVTCRIPAPVSNFESIYANSNIYKKGNESDRFYSCKSSSRLKKGIRKTFEKKEKIFKWFTIRVPRKKLSNQYHSLNKVGGASKGNYIDREKSWWWCHRIGRVSRELSKYIKAFNILMWFNWKYTYKDQIFQARLQSHWKTWEM